MGDWAIGRLGDWRLRSEFEIRSALTLEVVDDSSRKDWPIIKSSIEKFTDCSWLEWASSATSHVSPARICAKSRHLMGGLQFAQDRFVTPEEMRARTKAFGVAILKFAKSLPSDPIVLEIVRQLVRSGTSVGANYRSACRAKSKRDFVSKLGTVEEEADESGFWLEVLVEAEITTALSVQSLTREAEELVRITVASIITARGHSR